MGPEAPAGPCWATLGKALSFSEPSVPGLEDMVRTETSTRVRVHKGQFSVDSLPRKRLGHRTECKARNHVLQKGYPRE